MPRHLSIAVVALWGQGSAGFFTLCSYNVHEGGHDIEELFANFFKPRCDVAVVNEANGWRHNGVDDLAARYGFDVELLATPTTYDIGILARRGAVGLRRGPETTTVPFFHHGVLHCELLGQDQTIHLLATHLTPHSTVRRRDEARRLVAIVKKLEGPAGRRNRPAVVIAGDLNTLSPLDRDQHDQLLPVLLANPRLRAKFLVPGATEQAGEIDYMPMSILLAELVDVAVGHDRRRKPHPTVPTALHVDKLHAAPMRLDYVLFNADAAAHLLSPAGDVTEVYALTDDFTDAASDHYPLVLTGLRRPDDAGDLARPILRPGHRHHHHSRDCDPTQRRDADGLCRPPQNSVSR